MIKKIPVTILGATGAVGQRFVSLLANHPWFEIVDLMASEKSAGLIYNQAVNWKISADIPNDLGEIKIKPCDPKKTDAKIAFSGLDSSVAGEIEEEFAKAGLVVISNSKNHRLDQDVPLLIPEVNPEHLELITKQKNRWNSQGFIVTNPNCTTVGLTMVLKPLHDAFKIKNVIVTTMQALSGAGYPGVPSLDIIDNVIPFIGDEEEKVETEPLKILGADFAISASCNRVAVRDGHTETVTIEFETKPTVAQVTEVLKNFQALPQQLNLPSAPRPPIVVRTESDRPQPNLDRMTGNGMSVVVGRIRPAKVFDISLTLLVHNTIRGAAGAAILNAELLKEKGLLHD
jgi:aspartate-semialdehyde dehydrogenase